MKDLRPLLGMYARKISLGSFQLVSNIYDLWILCIAIERPTMLFSYELACWFLASKTQATF